MGFKGFRVWGVWGFSGFGLYGLRILRVEGLGSEELGFVDSSAQGRGALGVAGCYGLEG